MRKLAPWLLISLIYTFAFPQHSLAAEISNPEQVLIFPYDEELVQAYQNMESRRDRFMTVFITAYSSTPDQTDSSPFITAAGTRVRPGIVAANFLPFGARIRIPKLFGERIFIVEDRMAERHDDRVDVWFPTRGQALAFGAAYSTIEIVD
ncbi:MAG: 3D domain-containing protein [Parcubacteria group bacterium GW2011_GWA2_47_8]|nr:MAG: 3D domain-containing protein [Parcubacteria group bacterium GW2011_GWA2_47_8]